MGIGSWQRVKSSARRRLLDLLLRKGMPHSRREEVTHESTETLEVLGHSNTVKCDNGITMNINSSTENKNARCRGGRRFGSQAEKWREVLEPFKLGIREGKF